MSRMQDLSRPQPGERNTITLASGVRFAKIISRRFVCRTCMTFCGELVPIIDGKLRERMRRLGWTLATPELQARYYCYSGCHDKPGWEPSHFDWDSTKEVNSVRAWPKEWSQDREAQELERKTRIERERFKQ